MRTKTEELVKKEKITCDICGVEGVPFPFGHDERIETCPICKRDICQREISFITVDVEGIDEMRIMFRQNSMEITICKDCGRDYGIVHAKLTDIKFEKRGDMDNCLICWRHLKDRYCEYCQVLYK